MSTIHFGQVFRLRANPTVHTKTIEDPDARERQVRQDAQTYAMLLQNEKTPAITGQRISDADMVYTNVGDKALDLYQARQAKILSKDGIDTLHLLELTATTMTRHENGTFGLVEPD